MRELATNRRDVLCGLGVLGATGLLSTRVGAEPAPPTSAEPAPPTTPFTRANYRAVVDAVVPRTPELAEELGDEHVAGGLDIGLDEFLITFVDNLFTVGSVGETDANLPLAEPVAALLDVAALQLIATGEHSEPPTLDRVLELLDVDDLLDVDELANDPERALQQSLFAGLSREDRLRAIEKLDAIDVDTAFLPGPVTEVDAALVGQLVVGFVEVIYYSEWQGYDDITEPPGERGFDEHDIQSWNQTDFPGVIDGAAALRGYWSKPGTSLGDGATWETIETDGGRPIQLRSQPGRFEENDYDTSDYEEIFATDGTPASGGPVENVISAVTGDAGADADGGNPVDDTLEGVTGLDTEDPIRSLYEDVIRGLLEVNR